MRVHRCEAYYACIGAQIGYFETIASWPAYHASRNRLDGVTAEQVQAAAVKHLAASNRTIGWFEPQK